MQDEEDGIVYDHPRFGGEPLVGGGLLSKPFHYLAGPMSNLPSFNFPAFDRASTRLREKGYNIVNPAELDSEIERRWAHESVDGAHNEILYRECLRRDLKIILNRNCVGVICLPDWFKSFGARAVEVYNARWLGLEFFEYEDHRDGPLLWHMDPVEVLAHNNLDWI
jgi:hypothetical protein